MPLSRSAVITLAKIIRSGVRASKLGAGSTWPGEIALRLDGELFKYFASQSKKIILIAGTNGKTTTAKMIETVLVHSGKKVILNASGANLDNGILTTFLSDARVTGSLRSDYFIFEVDEATIPIVLKHLEPHVLVFMNLFRDQLDRYGEVDAVMEKWQNAVQHLKRTHMIINADDPHLALLGKKIQAPVYFFGLNDPHLFLKKMEHATDTIYCPSCGNRLTFGGVYFSHLGKWACGRCGLTHPEVHIQSSDVDAPLPGVYNKYNTMAATQVCRLLGIPERDIRDGLASFTPAFGRFEKKIVHGKPCCIMLSKNPVGFNESIRTAQSLGAKTYLLVLNDRIPDGTDVSWIWDVDFERIPPEAQIVISGDRAFDLAVRIKYRAVSGVRNIKSGVLVEPNLERAIARVIEISAEGETAYILPTYSAMLEVRQLISGRKIL